MKKLILMILLLGPGLMSFAQQDSMMHKKEKMKMHNKDIMKKQGMMMQQPDYDKMKADLGLSDKQVDQLKQLDESMKPEMEKMRQRHMDQMQQMQAAHQADMDKMQQNRDEKLKSILTKEQYEKHLKEKSMHKGDKKRMPMRGHDGPPPPKN
jgi:hypothetical protein